MTDQRPPRADEVRKYYTKGVPNMVAVTHDAYQLLDSYAEEQRQRAERLEAELAQVLTLLCYGDHEGAKRRVKKALRHD